MLAETRKQKDMYAMFRKKIVSAIIFLLIIGSCTLIASADQTNDYDKYTFTNYGGEVYTPQPMEFGANLNGNESVTLENRTERKHVLLQFYDYPTDEQYEMLPNYGIEYLTSAAPYTLIVSMPAEMTAADLPAESGLRWMGEIPVENKYSQIYGLDVPEYARLEQGNISLSIKFYDDISHQNALDILNKYSNNIMNFSDSLEIVYKIVTTESNITLIASEDSIMSLGYGYDVTVDEKDFIDNEENTEEEEEEEEPEPVNEQEDDIQETTENIDEPEEKQSPGFTTTIGILTLTLIAIFKGNTRQKRK